MLERCPVIVNGKQCGLEMRLNRDETGNSIIEVHTCPRGHRTFRVSEAISEGPSDN